MGVIIGSVTEYYTSSDYKPVQKIGNQSETGPAITIISGIAVGMQSTAFPLLLICAGIFVAYKADGLYGIALAAVGMLSTCVPILLICIGIFVSYKCAGCTELPLRQWECFPQQALLLR